MSGRSVVLETPLFGERKNVGGQHFDEFTEKCLGFCIFMVGNDLKTVL